MATKMPPVPFRTPMANKSGILNIAWLTFFRDLFSRIGGPEALSNTELDTTGIVDDITDLESDMSDAQLDITNLETTDTTHTNQIAALQVDINGLNQGRAL